ncbi:MAG: adenylate/guanylate cyclase domain-containing protein [Alphaproteobacteria bacterium]|nr:adenylate/guanylate cyclase domain-containing protein [Alphaproteobacteria bacterium]
MHKADIRAAAEWLTDGARSAPQPQQVLAQLCERLVACGIPLWRVAVFIRTLHPNVMGRRFVWRSGAEVETSEAPFALLDSADFLHSPVARVYETSATIRRKLADPDCAIDFPILAELRAEGVTDYLAVPLFFTDGAIHVVTCTTRQRGGFTDAQIAGIEAIIAPLTRVAEIRMLRRMASILLDTYVGHSPGERILAGHIRRGDIEEIHAAIWLSDMRGFTALADRIPPRKLIDLLNRYFDCQVPAILDHRAEVLKFMGDGLLAIFPIADDNSDADEVCRRTLAAARQVRTNVAALSEEIGVEDLDALRFGLALHVGEVLYGNIGGGNRLDFTCIGPAVNLAARIEKLTGQLGRVILASEDFAHHCAQDFSGIGQFNLAGFGAPQPVFGANDEV